MVLLIPEGVVFLLCGLLQHLRECLSNKRHGLLQAIANRSIATQHMEVFSREVKGRAYNWLTVAIELSEDDFTHLLNLNTWETGIRIREFVGRRFWRQNKISREDRQNSVRMSWE